MLWMEIKLNNQILIILYLIDANKQATDELKQDCDDLNKKLNKHAFEFDNIKLLLNKVLVQNQTSSIGRIDSPKP